MVYLKISFFFLFPEKDLHRHKKITQAIEWNACSEKIFISNKKENQKEG